MSAAADQGASGRLALVAARRGGQVWLEVDLPACARCDRGRGCGAALLGSGKPGLMRVEATAQWQLGQRVSLPPLQGSLPRIAWLTHGVSVLGLLGGLTAGHALGAALGLALDLGLYLGPAAADLLALAGGMLGLWLVRRRRGRWADFITQR